MKRNYTWILFAFFFKFFLKERYILFLIILISNFLFITKMEAQRIRKENSLSLNAIIGIPLMYKDNNFQSSIPVFLTGEFKLKKFSFNIGIGVEFAKLELKNQDEATTLSNCPPILFVDTNSEIVRCYHCIKRNSFNLRFPIILNYYFLNRKKLQTFVSSGIILDYSFFNSGYGSFFEYNTQQMKIVSNELKNEEFKYNDFKYINYDAILQVAGKYALTEKLLLNLGIQYSISFEKFLLKYPNNDDKIFLLSGVTFLLARS